MTYEQRRRWRLAWAEWRRGWRHLAAGSAIFLCLAAVVVVLPLGGRMLRGFVAGSLAATWVWALYVITLLRTYPATVGEWGESFTRELLASKPFSWPVVHDVPMERRNIDHVAVSPRAVLAIETKFVGAGRQWATDARRPAAIEGARSSARSVRSLMRSLQLDPLPVEPVLMLWGPGSPVIPAGWEMHEEVVVVVGGRSKGWREAWSRGPITAPEAATIRAALMDFQQKRDAHERRIRRSQARRR